MIFRNPVRTMDTTSEKAANWKEEKQRRLDQSLEERRQVGLVCWISIMIILFFRNIFVMKILSSWRTSNRGQRCARKKLSL